MTVGELLLVLLAATTPQKTDPGTGFDHVLRTLVRIVGR
jgi:hypothetical protein